MPAPADDDLDRLRLKLAAGSCDGAAAPHEELRENFVAPVATAGGWRLGLARFERCCCPSSFDIWLVHAPPGERGCEPLPWVEASGAHRRPLHTEDPSVPELLALLCSPPRRAKAVGGRPRHALTRASRAGHGVYAVDVPAVVTSRNLVTGPLDLHSHRSPRLLSMQAS